MQEMTNHCKCGCGTEIADDKTWVVGHNRKGISMSKEHKKKLSDSHKDKTFTEEHKQKLSDARKGKSSWNKGKKCKPCTTETKQKISDANKGRTRTAETKKKMSDAKKGIPRTEEQKKKQSDIMKGRPSIMKGKTHTIETRKHISAGLQGVTYDEWESFSCEFLYCPKFNEECRESCREKYNRKCFICGKSEKDNGQKLSVHHVDMDKAQGCNSNWKLVPLCKHHHATAHNDELIARLGYLLSDTL